MTLSDQAAFLISLQERSDKVWDDVRQEREIDRATLRLLESRVLALEQASAGVKKHQRPQFITVIQNPTVLFAMITIIALLLVAKVDFNIVLSKLIEYLAK